VARVPSGRSEQWYLTEGRDSSPRASKDWPADFVTVEHEGRVAGPESLTRRTIQSIGATRPASIVTGAAILGGGAAFAWWAYSKSKRVKRNTGRRALFRVTGAERVREGRRVSRR